ncbi:hypothetical protein DERP_000726 [Dermatophagoides pteronyssinus]|uniref:Uncharacterized protein n=1 Tax=Dermatophagoides pteronyssinus TaxID=6956 RepID=A0ABQ8J0Y8_DERPT|nr:hypothetical protein DERP_000726 [Dermatophagoides pteronyssinus]
MLKDHFINNQLDWIGLNSQISFQGLIIIYSSSSSSTMSLNSFTLTMINNRLINKSNSFKIGRPFQLQRYH